MGSKTISSKKGFFGGALVDFWTYVAFIVIVAAFYAFFKVQAASIKEAKVFEFEDNLKADSALVNYLRTPVTITLDNRDQNMNIAELISAYYMLQATPREAEIQKILGGKTKEIFSDMPNLRLALKVSDRKSGTDSATSALLEETPSQPSRFSTLVNDIGSSCAFIPLPNSPGGIKVELIIINLQTDAFVKTEYGAYEILRQSTFDC